MYRTARLWVCILVTPPQNNDQGSVHCLTQLLVHSPPPGPFPLWPSSGSIWQHQQQHTTAMFCSCVLADKDALRPCWNYTRWAECSGRRDSSLVLEILQLLCISTAASGCLACDAAILLQPHRAKLPGCRILLERRTGGYTQWKTSATCRLDTDLPR